MKCFILIFLFLILSFQVVIYQSCNSLNTDSVVYLPGKWETIITTQEDAEHLKQKVPDPYDPPTPFYFTINRMGQIKMNIIDSNSIIVKSYIFDIFIPGTYQINWWAFYKSLPSGKYLYDIETPNEKQILKIYKQ